MTVSKTRIIYHCFHCGGIVAWSDCEPQIEIKEKEKVRPLVSNYKEELLQNLV